MKELVLFYSYSGNTKKIAEKFGQENNFEVCEILDEKRPGKLSAYTAGIVKVIKGGGRKIKPLIINGNAVRFEDYDAIDVFSPVWVGHITPSMVSALKLLPHGTKIKLYLISASGQSAKDSMTKRLQDLGLEIADYKDIKS